MRQKKPINFSESGFSLLELIVTLAIAGVIVAVGVPSFSSTLDNQRMLAATNEMVMTLNLAKSEAIKRVSYVTVCRSSNGTSCTGGSSTWSDGWIVFANNGVTNLNTVDAGEEVLRVSPALREGLNISPSGGIDGFISFRPSGTIGTTTGNQSGTMTTCDKRGADSARGIVLQASGQWNVSYDDDHAGDSLTCASASDGG